MAYTTYSTLGRKTITAVINGKPITLKDYLDIRDSGTGTEGTILAQEDTICAGESPKLRSSIDALLYYWDFGGAAPSDSGPHLKVIHNKPFHIPGVYWIKLRTYSGCCGFSETSKKKIVVRPRPLPLVRLNTSLRNNTLCQGEVVTFRVQATNVGENPTFLWFKNNQLLNLPSIPVITLHSLSDGDEIRCGIISSAECDFGDTLYSNVIKVRVRPLPRLASSCFELINPPANIGPGDILNLAVIEPQNEYEYFWNMGNNTGAVGKKITTIYKEAGVYTVTLIAKDTFGCRSLPCAKSIRIQPFVEADFITDRFAGCAPLSIRFLNRSKNGITYLWDFGDGKGFSTDINPLYTYEKPGNYTVTLKAFGRFYEDTLVRTKVITVFPKPIADFICFPSFISSSSKDTVYFLSKAIGAKHWFWDFGDPTFTNDTSTQINPKYMYLFEGKYNVTLIVRNEFGCRDSIQRVNAVIKGIPNSIEANLHPSKNIKVFPNPANQYYELSFSTPICQECIFTIELWDAIGRKLKILDEGRLTPYKDYHSGFSINREYLTAGTYWIRIKVDNLYLTAPLIIK
ncbi:MAG: PKD domain-containing protein [Bacteroidia bacterium]|nr:PKD domain-containing protein [Bacteroidia bacterium]